MFIVDIPSLFWGTPKLINLDDYQLKPEVAKKRLEDNIAEVERMIAYHEDRGKEFIQKRDTLKKELAEFK